MTVKKVYRWALERYEELQRIQKRRNRPKMNGFALLVSSED